ncbi:MAG: YHS domain-containing protein [Chthoniobacterales bacterium]
MDDEPTVIVYEGQEVKFCCKKCKKKFNSDPEKYLKKLNEEEAKSSAS